MEHIEIVKYKLKEGFTKRAAIEPKIGHLKADHRLNRNFYKGIKGDNINVMLAAAAMNFKRMMNIWKDYLLALFLRFIQLSKYYYNNQITISILAY